MSPKLFCHVISLKNIVYLLLLINIVKVKPMSQENQESYISNCNTRRRYEINRLKRSEWVGLVLPPAHYELPVWWSKLFVVLFLNVCEKFCYVGYACGEYGGSASGYSSGPDYHQQHCVKCVKFSELANVSLNLPIERGSLSRRPLRVTQTQKTSLTHYV